MLDDIMTAIALVLVIEGIFPFLAPGKWKMIFYQAVQMPNANLRIVGLISMLLGVLLLYFSVR